MVWRRNRLVEELPRQSVRSYDRRCARLTMKRQTSDRRSYESERLTQLTTGRSKSMYSAASSGLAKSIVLSSKWTIRP